MDRSDADKLREHLYRIQQLWQDLQATSENHSSSLQSFEYKALMKRIRAETDAFRLALDRSKEQLPPS